MHAWRGRHAMRALLTREADAEGGVSCGRLGPVGGWVGGGMSACKNVRKYAHARASMSVALACARDSAACMRACVLVWPTVGAIH